MRDTSLINMIALPVNSLNQQVLLQHPQQVARGLPLIVLHQAVAPVPTPVIISATVIPKVVSVQNPHLSLTFLLPLQPFSTRSQR